MLLLFLPLTLLFSGDIFVQEMLTFTTTLNTLMLTLRLESAGSITDTVLKGQPLIVLMSLRLSVKSQRMKQNGFLKDSQVICESHRQMVFYRTDSTWSNSKLFTSFRICMPLVRKLSMSLSAVISLDITTSISTTRCTFSRYFEFLTQAGRYEYRNKGVDMFIESLASILILPHIRIKWTS